uniref:Uncharacterized protein n=1 Tax=Rhizophora mucronata TaxID=61149 RepID=A0A2P2P3B2_RHIMU
MTYHHATSCSKPFKTPLAGKRSKYQNITLKDHLVHRLDSQSNHDKQN